MGLIRMLALGVVVGWAAVTVRRLFYEPPVPVLHPSPWWGPGEPQPEDATITQFKINIPQKDVDGLQQRLALPLRLTPVLEGANFTYGFNADTLTRIVNYWKSKYNWRQREAQLNNYPHFKTKIEGLDIHFLRAKGEGGERRGVKVVPLLLLHGWPGSFVEFYRILPLLTTPQQGSKVVFEVICPSIPGYGFSQGSTKKGLGRMQVAQILMKLMRRLGYEQFYVQGGDWGSGIVTDMAIMYPQNILGVHVNFLMQNNMRSMLKMLAGSVLPSSIFGDTEKHNIYPLSQYFSVLMQESGYLHIQATKPDTIGNAVNQSPVALAAYILEKFSTGTNLANTHQPDGGLLRTDFPISLDSMLDNICIYWFTGSFTTSVRFYAENLPLTGKDIDKIPCRVPAGLAMFAYDILSLPETIAASKYHDIVTYSTLPEGGHFAAMEKPELLAADVHKFVNAVEDRA